MILDEEIFTLKDTDAYIVTKALCLGLLNSQNSSNHKPVKEIIIKLSEPKLSYLLAEKLCK